MMPVQQPDKTPAMSPVWPDIEAIEEIVEDRVIERLETELFLWRFRLMSIESFVVAGLVIAIGLKLQYPMVMVLRASMLVAAGCFVTGLILVGLSAVTMTVILRARQWWRK